jgi:hypothetical protein
MQRSKSGAFSRSIDSLTACAILAQVNGTAHTALSELIQAASTNVAAGSRAFGRSCAISNHALS